MAALCFECNILPAPSTSLSPLAVPTGGCGVHGVCVY